MKRNIVPLAALGAVVFAAGVACGQPKPNAPLVAPAKPQRLLKVATITGAQVVREFQANVQLVQAQRNAAAELQAAMDKETDAQKKKELQTKLDALMAKLNENNATMVKTYGFSLARNYTMEIETANIYLEVTDEEAAKIEEAAKAEAAKK